MKKKKPAPKKTVAKAKAKAKPKKTVRKARPLTTEQKLRAALLQIVDLEPAASPGMTTQLGVNLETAQDIAREALGD